MRLQRMAVEQQQKTFQSQPVTFAGWKTTRKYLSEFDLYVLLVASQSNFNND